jgi:hypothetical protein
MAQARQGREGNYLLNIRSASHEVGGMDKMSRAMCDS